MISINSQRYTGAYRLIVRKGTDESELGPLQLYLAFIDDTPNHYEILGVKPFSTAVSPLVVRSGDNVYIDLRDNSLINSNLTDRYGTDQGWGGQLVYPEFPSVEISYDLGNCKITFHIYDLSESDWWYDGTVV